MFSFCMLGKLAKHLDNWSKDLNEVWWKMKSDAKKQLIRLDFGANISIMCSFILIQRND